MVDLSKAWRKFSDGDGLTEEELNALIDDVDQGIRFLTNREETGGVRFKAILDREVLLGFRGARKRWGQAPVQLPQSTGGAHSG